MDFPYFEWDSFFNGNLAAVDDPAIAKNTIRAPFFPARVPEGMVPNFGHWNGGASMDRSEPPVAAACASGRCDQRSSGRSRFSSRGLSERWSRITRGGRNIGTQKRTGCSNGARRRAIFRAHHSKPAGMTIFTIESGADARQHDELLCRRSLLDVVDRRALPRANHRRYAGQTRRRRGLSCKNEADMNLADQRKALER